MIQYIEQDIKGLFLMIPDVYADSRGSFAEIVKEEEMRLKTGASRMIQDNESVSARGVLRGMHLQKGEYSQAKWVRCPYGAVWDVVVDLRVASPTYGQSRGFYLSQENHHQLYIPRNFAHGYVALTDQALFQYRVDNVYNPQSECCIHYLDPDLAIDWDWARWGIENLILSDKDALGISFREYEQEISLIKNI